MKKNITIPSGYKATPINTTRTSRILYQYTNQHEGEIAGSVFRLWGKQAKELFTSDVISEIQRTAQVPQSVMDGIHDSNEKWVVEVLAPEWERAMALGATEMIKAIEKFLGTDLGETPKGIIPEAKALIDKYYAGTWNPKFFTDFPELAESLTGWIKTRGGFKIKDMTDRQVGTIKNVVRRGVVEQGINGADLAHQLQHSTGLTQKMEERVEKHRQALKAEGANVTTIRNSAAKFSRTMRKQRALQIGRTELAYAYNSAAHESVQNSITQGHIIDVVIKEWYTALDERVCVYCQPLHGKKVGMTETWKSDVQVSRVRVIQQESKEYPPLHTLCRCVILYRALQKAA